MSTIPAKQIERNRIIPAVEITYVPHRQTTPMTSRKFYCFALGGGT